ncbi:FAD/NAD(P)-binding domain-containing protein [Dissoconium aciculare CBS 342.82]|uniref:FAD/NAD(P)-binding domain-containing protein n=1 Tax=Dissoconium aciculare CBS 342.82 TaxID=1314786 RepID=A0A6J3MAG1_9PEZI|nr:FAD/NAD(P)-binding domain-containing protein [Dissoconium aciculare CBS 342.82]KAF1824843.1 FAD/NAD(P)-binding domain-containing protein [Dissoconium aciculare CBS 342.82]
MTQLSVLVVGGGVAGSVVAYWLGKGGAQVTVIERSSASLEAGQGIDVEGVPREIVRRMGAVDEMKARSTGEPGIACLDDDGKPLAFIPGLLTSDIEIMRGDLTDILATAAKRWDNVTFQYNRSVTTLEQRTGVDGGVFVTFNDDSKARFDVIVGADGLRSKTREMIFGPTISHNAIKPLDLYSAFFSIPAEEHDAKHSTLQSVIGRRSTLIRPVNKDRSSAYMSFINKDPAFIAAFQQTNRESGAERIQAQKDLILKSLPADIATGQVPRILEGLRTTQNFYFDRIAQVKLSSWSRGRGVLVGDAGYAPGPITGEGTNLAIVGAYVLAGEITRHVLTSSGQDEKQPAPLDDSITAAFTSYESLFRDYVTSSQQIPGAGRMPDFLHPTGRWGIWTLRLVFRFFAASRLYKLVGWKSLEDARDKEKLPEWMPVYEKFV